MTPTDYKRIKAEQEAILARTTRQTAEIIALAYEQAKHCKTPRSVRPAKAGDMVPGVVLWYICPIEHHTEWHILEPGETKSLKNAFIEIK
jgi:hypothetical protein